MKDEQRSYPLPTETLPGLDLSHHLEDLIKIRDFFESRGIKTSNTRIERYIQYLQQANRQGSTDASKIFKNSVEGPFESPIDWLLYVLREVHELMWILKGLKVHLPLGIDEKLKVVASGSDFAALDTDSQSRNTQFELRIASYFCQGGCEVDMSTETDIIALTDDHAFYLECKRVGSKSQLGKRLSEARKQLNNRMPQKNGKRLVLGCIAADVTKVAFSHNGLTLGLTNEHSRDIIQEKLVEIARTSDKLLVFEGCRNLLGYWLQIHIPSLIIRPAMPVTRLSSCHIPREGMRRKEQKVARAFYGIFESVSKGDHRAIPPKKLTPHTRIAFPKGTTFSLNDDRIVELLEQGEITENEQAEIIGTLSFNDKDYEFTFFEVGMLPTSFMRDWRKVISKNPVQAKFQLIASLYAQRFPYEESEDDIQVSPKPGSTS